MRISNATNKINPSHKGLYNNKVLLKGLETISEHSTSFVALTTLAMATCIRPLAIKLTPNVKKENKEYAISNSITSGLIKFGLAEAIAIPIENAVKQIDKSPEKFLNKKTIKALQGSAKTLAESKNYKFATQVMKLSAGLISAIPKAILTVSLIPIVKNALFGKKEKEKEIKKNKNINEQLFSEYNSVFSPSFQKYQPSFKGVSTVTAKGLGKILNNNTIQNLAKTFSPKDADIARNISMATDILLTTSFIHQTMKNKEIEKERKKPLIYNNLISTEVSLVGGFTIDKMVKKGTEKFIEKFSQINKNNPKLNKYIEGINILRPTLIFAGIYYGILPMVSTFMSDKFSEKQDKKSEA